MRPGTLANALATPLAACLLAAGGAGCARRADAPRAYADDADNHDFALDLPRRRIVYVEGAYPRKSYLCVQPLDGGRARCRRLKGYALGGGVFPLPDGSALVAASSIRGEMNDPQAAPRQAAALQVSLADGSVLRTFGLPAGARLLGAAGSATSRRPLALVSARDGLHLSPLPDAGDQEAGQLAADAPVLTARTVSAAFSPDGASVAAASFDDEGGELSLLDPQGLGSRTLRVRSPGLVRPLSPGRWLVTLVDEEDRDVLAALDAATGRVRVLLTADGPIETAAAGPRWAFAVTLSSKGPLDARRPWLHPRELHRVDLTGREAAWSAPWTQRQGRLLAVDERAGRLWFAVTDRDAAALWSLPLEPGKLAAAVPALDGQSAFVRVAEVGIFWFFVIALGAIASVGGWLFFWRGRAA